MRRVWGCMEGAGWWQKCLLGADFERETALGNKLFLSFRVFVRGNLKRPDVYCIYLYLFLNVKFWEPQLPVYSVSYIGHHVLHIRPPLCCSMFVVWIYCAFLFDFSIVVSESFHLKIVTCLVWRFRLLWGKKKVYLSWRSVKPIFYVNKIFFFTFLTYKCGYWECLCNTPLLKIYPHFYNIKYFIILFYIMYYIDQIYM